MRIAGAIIALIAGIFGTLAAGFTLFMGGLGGAVSRYPGSYDSSLAEQSELVVMLGWGGVLFSFLTIILAAIAMGTQSRTPGILLIPSAIAGAILGGTLVAVFMVLAFVGGIVTIAAKREDPVRTKRVATGSFILPPLPGEATRVQPSSGSSAFCKACGKPLDGVQAFCGGCGAATQRTAPAAEAVLFESAEMNVRDSARAASVDSDPLLIPNHRPAVQKSSGMPVGVILASLAVVGGGGAAVLILNPSLVGLSPAADVVSAGEAQAGEPSVGELPTAESEVDPGLPPIPVVGMPSEEWNGETPTLCDTSESVSWSCKANGKIYSLCASQPIGERDGYIQYRVGVPGQLEFSYPDSLQHPRGHFTYTMYIQGNTSVTFTNGGYGYMLLAPLRGESEINVSKDGEIIASVSCQAGSSFEIIRPDLLGMAETPYGN